MGNNRLYCTNVLRNWFNLNIYLRIMNTIIKLIKNSVNKIDIDNQLIPLILINVNQLALKL